MAQFAESLGSGTSDLFSQFKSSVENIAEFFQNEGLDVKPYSDPKIPAFLKLSSDEQKNALMMAQTYERSLEMAERQGSSVKDSKKGLWCALKLWDLTPTSDIFERIASDDAVEIYNAAGIQIWRNFRAMEVIGYDIDQIFVYTWQERYERNDTALQQILEVIGHMAGENRPRTYEVGIQNRLVELFSEKRYEVDVRHDFLSSVINKDKAFDGFIVVSKVNLLGTGVEIPIKPQFRDTGTPFRIVE